MSVRELSAREIAGLVKRGELKATEVVRAVFDEIKNNEKKLNALITIMEERALKRAELIDEKVAKGQWKEKALLGVPVVLKDNICVEGYPTTCGSKMLKKWISPYNAGIVDYLEEAGTILIGKSNMDEFAMGSSTEHSAFGPTSNPWDLERVPGGSSGGSAASVAAGYVPLAFGSDTGGSIRQPAAFCGVHGMKPTYGLVSRYGLVAFSSSLDQIGPFTRTVEDMALALDVIAKHDYRDSTCWTGNRPSYSEAILNANIKGMRVGVVRDFMEEGLDDELAQAVEKGLGILVENGAIPVDLNLGDIKECALPCYYIIAPAEASSNLARYDGVRYGLREDADNLLDQYIKTRGKGFGDEVKRRIMIGTFVLSSGYYDAYYLRGLKARKYVCEKFKEAFSNVDVIVMPSTPTPPFKKGELVGDPIQMYLSDIFTLPVNLAGLPGISVWMGLNSTGLPMAMQIIAPKWHEVRILKAAAKIEETIGACPLAPGGE
ncbi:Asp-tRNA(Asn)/Glu-tRNA(Gln) amidotransferase subunit GatA [Thermovirga sp.]|uniref:Asp-tRNA(Asn)/Glu-tRNA(Gln) amidotransferase subunit GatA n=1 Tax=Thermovirga sp. TaxID=2699834 RepID=UPI0026007762|nr:Asp-tRNA(Asn)/Glu-tRNA(Gln) amidotransferase subunit GatA [Thermovirga sp.]MBO8153363.1 Asp-tRNA(Asn)/Glu-tRNA(Gln) amidotransferase subunit GatA [Thermovirga sp.]